jgi:hypothetical protein
MKRTGQRIVTMVAAVIILQGLLPHCAASPWPALASPQARAIVLPDARIGQPYEFQFTSSGGRPPYKWRIVEGDLPPGIQLSKSGRLWGSPTVPLNEPASFVIEVADSSVPADRFERLVVLKIRPRRLSIDDGESGVRIIGGNEPAPVSIADPPRQEDDRDPQPYARRDGGRYSRQPRRSAYQRPLPDQDADEDEDATSQTVGGGDDDQRNPNEQTVGQGNHAMARLLDRLKKGVAVIRVAASPLTPVTVYVNDVVAGRAVTNERGRANVTIGASLANGDKVRAEEGSGDAPPVTSPKPAGDPPGNGHSPAPAPSNTPPPNIAAPLREGVQNITGTANPKESVTVSINNKALDPVTASGKGDFIVKDVKLVEGDKVTAKQDDGIESVTIIVEPPPPPKIAGDLHPGDLTFTVNSLPKAKLKVVIAGVVIKDEIEADANGVSIVKLQTPLAPKAYIQVKQNGSEFFATNVPDYLPETTWGRVRSYFYGGAVLSNRNRLSTDTTGNDFTKVDLAVGFTLDKTYIMTAGGGFFVNTFFDTRLTAIPVATMQPSKTTMTTTARRTLGTTQLADTTTDPFETFLTTKKAGLAQVGVYMPMAITRWDFGGNPNRLFVAPLGKFGIQTITSDIPSAEGVRLGEDNVYNFFGYGLRLGHYQLKYKSGPAIDTNIGPELISWLDITYGKWENFEILNPVIDPATGTAKPDPTDPKKFLMVRKRPWRVGAEGRLKIPTTPFMVGFDGNFGQGPDDLRFLFGIRFDIGKVLAKLQILQKLGLDK